MQKNTAFALKEWESTLGLMFEDLVLKTSGGQPLKTWPSLTATNYMEAL